jgi:hypothetical protein
VYSCQSSRSMSNTVWEPPSSWLIIYILCAYRSVISEYSGVPLPMLVPVSRAEIYRFFGTTFLLYGNYLTHRERFLFCTV